MNKKISVVSILTLASIVAACGGNSPPPNAPEAAVAEQRADKANDATEANTDRADKAADIPDAAQEGLRRAREHLCSAYEAMGGKAKAVNRAVHEHPWQAIAATGLVAFLLGLLVRRR